MSDPCTCMSEFDRLLAERNGKLGVTLMVSGTSMVARPTILVEKIAPRGKRPPGVIPTFCPFCGVRYPENNKADEG